MGGRAEGGAVARDQDICFSAARRLHGKMGVDLAATSPNGRIQAAAAVFVSSSTSRHPMEDEIELLLQSALGNDRTNGRVAVDAYDPVVQSHIMLQGRGCIPHSCG